MRRPSGDQCLGACTPGARRSDLLASRPVEVEHGDVGGAVLGVRVGEALAVRCPGGRPRVDRGEGEAARDARGGLEGPEVAAVPVRVPDVRRDPAAVGRDLQQAEGAGLADGARLAARPVEPGEAGDGRARLVGEGSPVGRHGERRRAAGPEPPDVPGHRHRLSRGLPGAGVEGQRDERPRADAQHVAGGRVVRLRVAGREAVGLRVVERGDAQAPVGDGPSEAAQEEVAPAVGQEAREGPLLAQGRCRHDRLHLAPARRDPVEPGVGAHGPGEQDGAVAAPGPRAREGNGGDRGRGPAVDRHALQVVSGEERDLAPVGREERRDAAPPSPRAGAPGRPRPTRPTGSTRRPSHP